MRDYQAFDLLLPSATIFAAVLILAFLVTKAPLLSLGAASIKSGVFFANFALVFSGQVTGFDDLYYLDTAYKLAQGNFQFTDLVLRRDEISAVTASSHIVYPMHNYYSTLLFGNHYFAPVALNVLLTCLVAFVGMRLALAEFGLSRKEGRGFFLFLLLYPEVLAWSSVFNGKETLVLLGHLLLLAGASRFFRGRILSSLLIILPTSFVMAGLRYYVPALFVLAFLVYALTTYQAKHRKKILLLAMLVFGAVLAQVYQGLGYGLALVKSSLINPAFGLLHFILTPIPFRAQPEYEFLNWPSLYHWLALPLFVIGFIMLYRMRTPFARFTVIYFLIFIAFYSVFAELQGSRHRFQLAFVFAICEYRGALALLKSVVRWPSVNTERHLVGISQSTAVDLV